MKVLDLNNDEEALEEISDKDFEDNDEEELEEESASTFSIVIKEIFSVILNVAICFALVFLITHYVGQRTVVSGSSMEDTLTNGDNLIVDRISYRFTDPERFDVIVFPFQYEDNTYYIKRIIGLPGERVYINSEGDIFIDGVLLEEDYGTEIISSPGLASDEILLGEDEYFVLGDNRNNSTDSRFESVGNIKGDDIVGRAWVRIFPFNKAGFISNLE